MFDTWRCEHCAGVIGVYEPMVFVLDGEGHETSRAAIKDNHVSERARLYHRACYELCSAAPNDDHLRR
jgi:hypothetical protein